MSTKGSLTSWVLQIVRSPQLTCHSGDTGCVCDVLVAPAEKGLVLDLPEEWRWEWEGQTVSKWRSLGRAASSDQIHPQQFCPHLVWLALRWLFWWPPSQDRSCRKFIITSLLVKLQPSHCLRISMACKWLGEGWWQWDSSRWGVGWGDIWKQSSVSSHRRSNFKHANNFQFHFSFFLLEGSSVAISEAWADNVIFMPPTSSFSRAGMGWHFSGCLPRLQPACYFMALD